MHNREGGSANDLVKTFDSGSVPEINSLTGEPIRGDWTLHVQDLAPADRGRLKSWSLDIKGLQQTSVFLEDSPGIIIPDNIPAGIERVLSVTQSGTLEDLEVSIDITHTYIGDLMLELEAPDGKAVLLHNRTGGSTDNIIKKFTFLNTGKLQEFRGVPVQGNWKLKVSDRAGADQGKLNHWSLKLTLK